MSRRCNGTAKPETYSPSDANRWTRKILLRASRCVTLIAASLAMCPPLSLAETSLSQCVSDVQMKYGASPAFKIACTSPGDCEFEPSQAVNASALALIDVMAKAVIACWQGGGLTTVVDVASPPSLKLIVRRYRASGN